LEKRERKRERWMLVVMYIFMDYFVCLDIDFETTMSGSLKHNSILGGQDGNCNVDYPGFEFEPK
jgi:hypothetical protein